MRQRQEIGLIIVGFSLIITININSLYNHICKIFLKQSHSRAGFVAWPLSNIDVPTILVCLFDPVFDAEIKGEI